MLGRPLGQALHRRRPPVLALGLKPEPPAMLRRGAISAVELADDRRPRPPRQRHFVRNPARRPLAASRWRGESYAGLRRRGKQNSSVARSVHVISAAT